MFPLLILASIRVLHVWHTPPVCTHLYSSSSSSRPRRGKLARCKLCTSYEATSSSIEMWHTTSLYVVPHIHCQTSPMLLVYMLGKDVFLKCVPFPFEWPLSVPHPFFQICTCMDGHVCMCIRVTISIHIISDIIHDYCVTDTIVWRLCVKFVHGISCSICICAVQLCAVVSWLSCLLVMHITLSNSVMNTHIGI